MRARLRAGAAARQVRVRAAAARHQRRGAAEGERRAARRRVLMVNHVPLLLLLRSALRCGGRPLRAAHTASRMCCVQCGRCERGGRRTAVGRGRHTYTCVMDMLPLEVFEALAVSLVS